MTAEDLVAQTILQGFDAQYGRFLEITSGAQYRFEQADWHGIQLAMKERIRLYDNHVGLVVEQLRCIRHDIDKESVFLQKVKERYTQLLPNYPRFEIAESFFNSVYCRLFHQNSRCPLLVDEMRRCSLSIVQQILFLVPFQHSVSYLHL